MSASPADAEQKPATPAEGAAPAAKAKPKAIVLIGVIIAAIGAGAGGGFVLAPRLAPPAAGKADSADAEPGHDTKEHGKGEKEGGKIFKIENLIVNPAGSEGARFLMTSVAFEVETEVAEAALKDHDVQVRDLIVTRLESQTMRMLTQPYARDSIKRLLAAAIVPLVGPKARVTVYLPQFVIQ
jgi:flagellar FliL protein